MNNFRVILTLLTIGFISLGQTSCRKKGNCYCKYVSGDKKHYNLTSLSRSEQKDSCSVLDGNAEHYGGSCELK